MYNEQYCKRVYFCFGNLLRKTLTRTSTWRQFYDTYMYFRYINKVVGVKFYHGRNILEESNIVKTRKLNTPPPPTKISTFTVWTRDKSLGFLLS